MARLELDVVQTSSGSGVKDAATALEALYQAEQRVRKASDDEAKALRGVEIAQKRLDDTRKTAKAGSAQLLAAEDKLATALSKVNQASAKTQSALGTLAQKQKEAAAASDKFTLSTDKVHASSGKASGGLGLLAKAGGAMAGALGIANLAADAGRAVADFATGSITAASDLQQASGAAQAVFGKDFPAISAAADTAATSVGLASSEYQQMAAVLGAGLKNQGIEDFAGQTQKVIGLGADLAAQFGGSTQDAVEAIGSLMRGEADPVEKYGVSIKQTAIDAELAANGQDKLEGAAKTQAEAQARLKLLFQQTGQAQGTFARESDTLAGSQQRVSAQVKDLQAKLGTALLPALTGVTDYLSRTMSGGTGLSKVLGVLGDIVKAYVTPIIQRVQEGFANFRASIDKVTGGSEQTEAMLKKVGDVVGKLAGWVGDFVGGNLSLLLTGIGKLIEGGKLAADWIGKMTEKIGGITLPFGLGKVSDVVGNIATKLESAVGWLGKLFDGANNSGAVSALAGLFRDTGGYTTAGTGTRLVPFVVPAPVTPVYVQVDGASLRGIIRSEIRATLSRSGGIR